MISMQRNGQLVQLEKNEEISAGTVQVKNVIELSSVTIVSRVQET